ncbi:hypothetical protein OGAPHI_004023 [Ogataea philodendri]|uniref:Uncharacterized protein n=1 Tax=Ogataea philodendri TaxID=1378263 RepID=A0A9P8P5Z0_9ASCO|nr:uncharacterized protein OGAPHI_004023 [Ogataea philodendri]KAH3665835.1 hypothetical protein OGAPHI_004023 [Ogataea philodendri]
MTAHDLDHKRSLMGIGCCVDIVDGFADPRQRRVTADRGICERHVVVDGAQSTANVEMLVVLVLLGGDFPCFVELLNQGRPFCTEQVCARERTVSATHDQSVDTCVDHVLARCGPAPSLLELHTSGCADIGTTFSKPSTHVVPMHFPDILRPAFDKTRVPFVDSVRLAPLVDGSSDDCSDICVHSWSIAARSHDGDVFGRGHRLEHRLGAAGGVWRLLGLFAPEVLAGANGVCNVSEPNNSPQRVHHVHLVRIELVWTGLKRHAGCLESLDQRVQFGRSETNVALEGSPVKLLFLLQQMVDVGGDFLCCDGSGGVHLDLNGGCFLVSSLDLQNTGVCVVLGNLEPQHLFVEPHRLAKQRPVRSVVNGQTDTAQ